MTYMRSYSRPVILTITHGRLAIVLRSRSAARSITVLGRTKYGSRKSSDKGFQVRPIVSGPASPVCAVAIKLTNASWASCAVALMRKLRNRMGDAKHVGLKCQASELPRLGIHRRGITCGKRIAL